MNKLNMFLNDTFKVLEKLYDANVNFMGQETSRITQEEIGSSLGFSRRKIWQHMGILERNNLIKNTGKGRYILSEEAKRMVKYINKYK